MTNSQANDVVRTATDKVVEVEGALESYVNERPFTAVIVAFVAGAILAKVFYNPFRR